MSVLIKGLEMPTLCADCKMYVEDTYCCQLLQRELENPWADDGVELDCPLVPVQPHGRLIDADEFLKRAIGTKCFRGDYALMLEELVGESTTIIPAEEGET